MKRVSLIHTVPTVYASFGSMILERISGIVISNSVDEYLASDAEEKGRMTPENRSRLFAILKTSEATRAAAIVVTCSTLSPIVDELRSFIGVPVVTIDEAMLGEAVQTGRRIAIVATANSTIGPTTEHLERRAREIGKEIVVTQTVCSKAYDAIKRRDKESHDRLVLSALEGIKNADVVVLAQASMAHLEQQGTKLTGIPVLSSPGRCISMLSKVIGAAS